jgi:hypothetical protein
MRNTYHRYFHEEEKIYDWDAKLNDTIDSDLQHKQVAEERKPTDLQIPLATFIENEQHYLKYKCVKEASKSKKSDDKSLISESTTPRSQISKVAAIHKFGKQNITNYLNFLKS